MSKNAEFVKDMCAEISVALLNSGVPGECQSCHKGVMRVQPGASSSVLSDGRTLRFAVTTCDRCGHKEEYDIGTLGLAKKLRLGDRQ